MKIIDYEKVKRVGANDVLLLDGENGTKTILASDLAVALIDLLRSEDFISGLTMTDLTATEGLSAENMLLVGTEDGNKAIPADALAKGLITLLSSEEFISGLAMADLSAINTIPATDRLLVGTNAGNKVITAANLAKSLVAALSSDDFISGLTMSELTDVTTLSADNNILVGTADGNRAMTASNLAKAVVSLLSAGDFIAGVKMADIPQVSVISAADRLLVGTAAGNKAINASDAFFSMLDTFIAPEQRRMTFRGKNLGGAVTTAQKAAIRDGSFKGLFLGDYWVINNVTWRIADFDYWVNCGDTAAPPHHLVIVPDTALYNHVMNDTHTTEGGYTGSKMRIEGLNAAKTTIVAAFGDMVLTHRENLVNSVADGRPSGCPWTDSSVEIMSEIMVYGCHHFAPTSDGTIVPGNWTISNSQLALMAVCPRFIKTRQDYWLRDVVSAASFALVYWNGSSNYYGAAYSYGVRPAFPVG